MYKLTQEERLKIYQEMHLQMIAEDAKKQVYKNIGGNKYIINKFYADAYEDLARVFLERQNDSISANELWQNIIAEDIATILRTHDRWTVMALDNISSDFISEVEEKCCEAFQISDIAFLVPENHIFTLSKIATRYNYTLKKTTDFDSSNYKDVLEDGFSIKGLKNNRIKTVVEKDESFECILHA